MLPFINGYELLEYIKPIGPPVIFLTAKGGVADRIKEFDLLAELIQNKKLLYNVKDYMKKRGEKHTWEILVL